MHLNSLTAHKILNSRNEPTIAVTAEVKGKKVEASAPSGKSKGKYEVKEFSSKGLDFSIAFVNSLGKKLVDEKINFEVFDDLKKVEDLVNKYDATKNLSFVGGNTLYVLETAILKALAINEEKELWEFLLQGKKPKIPLPLGNCIGGGLHIKQGKKTDFQEFLIMPRTKKIFDAQFINIQFYNQALKEIKEKDVLWQDTFTDENAIGATLNNEEVLELMNNIREKMQDKFNVKIDLGLDAASSSLWQAQMYRYKNKKYELTTKDQQEFIKKISQDFNVYYIEDPLNENDFQGFSVLNSNLKNKLIVGDDLTATNPERVERALKMKSINGLIIKPNQIGSLIKTRQVIEMARQHNITMIISHRSGETLDNALAHFAVGWQIPIIKCGIVGKERLAKINELIRIEKSV